jgi:hypothetical protein
LASSSQWFESKFYLPMAGETQRQQGLCLALRRLVVPFVTCALLKGALLRTTLIAGSFAIINSAVNKDALEDRGKKRSARVHL